MIPESVFLIGLIASADLDNWRGCPACGQCLHSLPAHRLAQ